MGVEDCTDQVIAFFVVEDQSGDASGGSNKSVFNA